VPTQTPPKNPRRMYYQPRQMTFLVTHDGEMKDEQLNALLQQVNRSLEGQGARVVWRKVTSFPAASPREVAQAKETGRAKLAATRPPLAEARKAFSLVFANVETGNREFNVLKNIYDLDRKLVTGQLIAGLGLEAITPNWLVSSTQSGGIGVGGPGGRPVPYMGDPANPPYKFQFEVKAVAQSLGAKAGAGVDVAILDTAPCLHDLVEAYYGCQPPHAATPHPLLEGLLNPTTGKLKLYPAEQEDLFALQNYELEEHTYRMSDHGLFAAGIIHSIAPEASLHLIEVLNPYGVGDLLSIANGLRRLTTRDWSRPLVVNCSLMVNIPVDKKHRWHADKTFGGLMTDPAFVARQALPLQYVCNLLAAQGRCVVAAAGNDAPSSSDRPQARFPAAFTSALGVGALPRGAEASGFETASYSNLADRPQGTGLVTLGGEPGEEQGVLGVYIGDFPDGTPRCHPGWAWWAGTSFATPIISGLLAAQQSGQQGTGLLETAHQLFDPVMSTSTTPQGERVIFVQQK
jgi:hypothetical protein